MTSDVLLEEMPKDVRLTQRLLDWQAGDPEALEHIVAVTYERLRNIANRCLNNERKGHTLSPTDLIHESFLVLIDQTRIQWRETNQFYAMVAVIMRRVLVDYAKSRRAQKRGGGQVKITLSEDEHESPLGFDPERLNDALDAFAKVEPRGSQIVSYKFFVGLSRSEIARLLGVSEATVSREWKVARAWLNAYLKQGDVVSE